MANCLGNLGVVYDLQKKYSDALALYFRALKMGSEMGNKRIIASNHTNIGASYVNLNKRDTALIHFQKAKLLYEYLKDNNNLATVLSQTGEIYANQKKFTQAIELQKKALQYATSAEAPGSQNEIWQNLFETYKQQGDYKNALTALEKHVALNDSILDKEKIQQLGRKEAEFENEKKTAVLQATHIAELKHQKTVRNSLAGGAGLLLAVGGVLFWSYKRRRDAEELVQIIDTQMKVLRLQMNPHFIFNSLSSINDYISRNNVDEAGEYLTSFAKVMRLTLENSEQKEVPLADDLEALRLYMQLEAKRLNNKFTYSIDVTDNIDQENTLVPPMLLQPFAENSIWHGIGKKQGNGHITISIRKQNNMLHCSVEDDGVGRTGAAQQAAPGERKSLGMTITQSRIDMLNKLKNAKATVQVTDKENGLKAEVILPLETAF
jgi:tetratricopeptide (TPR) repeat protein